MPLLVIEKPDTRLAVAERRSEHPRIGKAYTRQTGEILYSARLASTSNMTFYTIQTSMPEGIRMSDSAEELAKQLEIERAGQDPRTDAFFDDLFTRNKDKVYKWQWTLTGLRVPRRSTPNYSPEKPDYVDSQGRKYWARMLLIGDKEVGEVLVPEGNWRAVVEWDEVTGLAKITSDKEGDMRYGNHTTHFRFDPNPDVDKNSGHKDVAVERRGGWHRGERGGCLDVYAHGRRSDSDLYDGFRPVQGSLVLPSVEEINRAVDEL